MISPFGESALLVETVTPERAQHLAASVNARPITGVVEVVPGLGSLLVELDPLAGDPDAAAAELEHRLRDLPDEALSGRRHTIPVAYGGADGPDLDEVAALCGLSSEEVIARHAGAEHRVMFMGFAPGFAYLGGLPDELRAPRLATPRTRTPAGSVAIAEAMSGIYPAALPGGWRVIGRTSLTLFDARGDPPALLAPGDTVRFEPIERDP